MRIAKPTAGFCLLLLLLLVLLVVVVYRGTTDTKKDFSQWSIEVSAELVLDFYRAFGRLPENGTELWGEEIPNDGCNMPLEYSIQDQGRLEFEILANCEDGVVLLFRIENGELFISGINGSPTEVPYEKGHIQAR